MNVLLESPKAGKYKLINTKEEKKKNFYIILNGEVCSTSYCIVFFH